MENINEIRNAVDLYVKNCSDLLSQYSDNTLKADWEFCKHGYEICFTNKKTGQVIEVPVGYEGVSNKNVTPELKMIDPYFWSIFVKSTPACSDVASLIEDDFHDSCRILKVLHELNKREGK